MITVTVKFTLIMGTSFKKLRSFFLKLYFIIKIMFPPLCETLYAGCLKLFAEASKLSSHAVFMLVVVVRKTTSLEYILQGAKEMEVRWWVLNRNSGEDEDLISLPVWPNPSNSLF
jgi:hypothetical protein